MTALIRFWTVITIVLSSPCKFLKNVVDISIFYIVFSCQREYRAAQLSCVLKNGLPFREFWHKRNLLSSASHLCHNKKCVDPKDIVFESGEANLKRCINGSSATCGCKAGACIWKRDGMFLPCRNDPNKCRCDCDLDCFCKTFNFYWNYLNYRVFSSTEFEREFLAGGRGKIVLTNIFNLGGQHSIQDFVGRVRCWVQGKTTFKVRGLSSGQFYQRGSNQVVKSEVMTLAGFQQRMILG